MTRRQAIFADKLEELHRGVDALFFWLLLSEWVVAVVVALVVSPRTWEGTQSSTHPHLWMALGFGALVNALPLFLIRARPGWWGTRHSVTIAQLLWSAIFIHLSGGRIETHFHIFGSLAFIAFYRDWKLLATATAVVVVDHLTRGLLWPQSIYGVANPQWWRFVEHASWVVFEDVVLILGCRRELSAMHNVADREAALEETQANTEQHVVERTAELAESMNRFRSLVETTNAVPWEYDLKANALVYIAPQAASLFGWAPELLKDPHIWETTLFPEDLQRLRSLLQRIDPAKPSPEYTIDLRLMSERGTVHVQCILSPRAADAPLRGLSLDVTKQRLLERELQQAQKLESVGRLASGVAHEINTPVQFVSDSVFFVRDAVRSYAEVIAQLRLVEESVLEGKVPLAAAEAARETIESSNLSYLLARVPKALDRSLEGLSRITTIVRSMKEFAHPDTTEMVGADLNRAIESTLIIAKNEYKYVADLETDFAELPQVVCRIGDINQAVLNIVVNAAHAIGDVVKGTDARGKIKVSTKCEGERVVIAISDTGGGIPEAARGKIFEPFFTTKEVGKGTGQGLAISRTVIADKHKGSLTFDTQVGQGTTFYIRLPIQPGLEGQRPERTPTGRPLDEPIKAEAA